MGFCLESHDHNKIRVVYYYDLQQLKDWSAEKKLWINIKFYFQFIVYCMYDSDQKLDNFSKLLFPEIISSFRRKANQRFIKQNIGFFTNEWRTQFRNIPNFETYPYENVYFQSSYELWEFGYVRNVYHRCIVAQLLR